MSSVRDYAILWVGARSGGSSIAGGAAALGGNALIQTKPHRLDGPEHLEPLDSTALDATADRHGLLPKLSGDVGDVLRGDGTFGPAALALDELADVNATGPTEGQLIRWSASASAWIKTDLPSPVVEADGTLVLESDGSLIWEW